MYYSNKWITRIVFHVYVVCKLRLHCMMCARQTCRKRYITRIKSTSYCMYMWYKNMFVIYMRCQTIPAAGFQCIYIYIYCGIREWTMVNGNGIYLSYPLCVFLTLEVVTYAFSELEILPRFLMLIYPYLQPPPPILLHRLDTLAWAVWYCNGSARMSDGTHMKKAWMSHVWMSRVMHV